MVIVIFVGQSDLAEAWGSKGHEAIVRLAFIHLPKAQREKLFRICGTRNYNRIANWADRQRTANPDSKHWHFVDIPNDADAYNSEASYAKNCIISALISLDSVLQKPHITRKQRRESTLYFIHLLGDLVQPFHCWTDSNRGGNDVQLLYNGSETTLHQLWDADLIESMNLTARQLAMKIAAPMSLHNSAGATFRMVIIDEANTSHGLAKEFSLASGTRVSPAYRKQALATIKSQLREGAFMTWNYLR